MAASTTHGIRQMRTALLKLEIAPEMATLIVASILMGSLIIIPPATAKRPASNLTWMLPIAVVVATIATVAGSNMARS